MLHRLPNLFTWTRLALVPVMLALAAAGEGVLFVGALACAFATDAVDGWLARRLRAATPRGAKLDSRADLALWLSLPVAVALLLPAFVRGEATTIALLLGALLLPLAAGLAKFRRMPSYHTWGAKLSAVLLVPGLLCVLTGGPVWPFRAAAAVTVLSALEELAITALLREPRTDVKSLWHVLRSR
jgi:CDP-diacylglycerol--glycerol-3-phosphate 3-phosphatidyltransferase